MPSTMVNLRRALVATTAERLRSGGCVKNDRLCDTALGHAGFGTGRLPLGLSEFPPHGLDHRPHGGDDDHGGRFVDVVIRPADGLLATQGRERRVAVLAA